MKFNTESTIGGENIITIGRTQDQKLAGVITSEDDGIVMVVWDKYSGHALSATAQDGQTFTQNIERFNLEKAKPTLVRKICLNVYSNDFGFLHESLDFAAAEAAHKEDDNYSHTVVMRLFSDGYCKTEEVIIPPAHRTLQAAE